MKKQFLYLIAGIFLFAGISYGANFEASIEGAEGFDLGGYSIWLNVDGDFDLLSDITDKEILRGGAIPTNWSLDTNIGTIGMGQDGIKRVIKLGAADLFAAMGMADLVPLVSGELFSFEYSGGILGYDLIELPSLSNEHFGNGDFFVKSFDDSGIVLSSVPIPSSLLLLGCGIFAVAGISRRKK